MQNLNSLAGKNKSAIIPSPLSHCVEKSTSILRGYFESRGFFILDHMRIFKSALKKNKNSGCFPLLCQFSYRPKNWLLAVALLGISLSGCLQPALAQQANRPQIDLSAIAQIESNTNTSAIGDSGNSYGAFQIHRKGILADFNKINGTNISPKSLLKLDTSAHLAIWAFEERLPQLIKVVAKKPVTKRSLIISWNCGVSCLDRKTLPKTTIEFLKKYERITGEKL